MVEQKTQPEAIKRRQLELRPLYAYSLLDVDQSRLTYAGRPVTAQTGATDIQFTPRFHSGQTQRAGVK